MQDMAPWRPAATPGPRKRECMMELIVLLVLGTLTLETMRSWEGSSLSTSTSVRRTCAASAAPTLPLVAV